MGTVGMILRHIGIATSQIEKSKDFYEKLGFEIFSDELEKGPFIENILGIEGLSVRTVKMKNQDFSIELLDFGSSSTIANFSIGSLCCTHFAVTVKSAKQTYENLLSMGALSISKPTTSPNGKVEVFFVKDPFNNFFIEIVEEK